MIILLTSGLFNIFTNALVGNKCIDSTLYHSMHEEGEDMKNMCMKTFIITNSLGNKFDNPQFLRI